MYWHVLQAVYDEINAQRPDIVRHADTTRRSQKYRHDENVIASTPAMYRQVVVPAPGLKEYVTGKDLFEFICVFLVTVLFQTCSFSIFIYLHFDLVLLQNNHSLFHNSNYYSIMVSTHALCSSGSQYESQPWVTSCPG